MAVEPIHIYIHGDFSTDDAIDWAVANCPSFEKYIVHELEWEEKERLDCWFRFDVYFTDERDALLFAMKWA